jgi:Flp pilus assembly protein TadD
MTAACAASPRGVSLTAPQWARVADRHGIDREVLVDPLAFDAEIQRAARELAGRGSPSEQLDRLQEELFEVGGPGFEYASAQSLTAGEAFESRSGNCLSFTNLFIAMGRSLGHRVQGAQPRFAPRSEHEGDLIIVNNHVVAAYLHAGGVTLYDFDRSRTGGPISFDLIDDVKMTALFLNNRGVEELQRDALDRATVQLDAATRLWPEFAAAWGNLAVVRRRSGDLPGALLAYRHALELEPRNPTVLANLAGLYRTLDKSVEAQTALTASRIRLAAPDVLVVQGDLWAQLGETGTALSLYRRAHHLEPSRAEPLVRIAKVELERGRIRRATRAATEALELAPGDAEVARLLERIRLVSSGP